MSLKDDLEEKVSEIFNNTWTHRSGRVVPEPTDLSLDNDAIDLEAAILYADLKGSTDMVDGFTVDFAAEVYKAFLHCAGKIIQNENGAITAYDGDRIMAIFIDSKQKCTRATRAALRINYAVENIINPEISEVYGSDHYSVKHVVGIDVSDISVARTGVWGNNDLVWVGPAANYAAKLCELGNSGHSTYMTSRTYKRINKNAKLSADKCMWEKRYWTSMNDLEIYRSNWVWEM